MGRATVTKAVLRPRTAALTTSLNVQVRVESGGGL